HWSPAGVAVAAKAVAQRLTELGWVKPGQVEYSERPVEVQRLGDIVRMMQVPMIEHTLQPENIPAVQVLRCDTTEPYKDEADAQMGIIGDRFMRGYQPE